MKTYSKIVVTLLFLSIIWFYLILNLTYFTFFQETCFFMPQINTFIQIKILYLLWIVISIGFLKLIFLNTKHTN
jgi:hypothetical protein